MAQDQIGVVANFYTKAIEDQNESRKAGRPIFKDVDMARLRYIGDKTRELHVPANERFIRDKVTGNWLTYADVFADQFKAYKAGLEYHEGGTPLSEIPFLTEAKRQELRGINVHTLEHIVQNEDRLRKQLGMGASELLAKAKAMFDKAAGGAVESRLAAENAALREKFDGLQAQVQEMLARANGQPVAPPVAEPVEVEVEGHFAGFSDDDLKAYIKDQSGQAPRGQPSRATLLRMAEELAAKVRESA